MKEEKLYEYLDIIIKEGNIGSDNNSINTILYERLSNDVGRGIEFFEVCEEVLTIGRIEGYINGSITENTDTIFEFTKKGLEYRKVIKPRLNDFLEKVSEFHRCFKAPILDTPQIPSEDRCKLRVNLIQEELNELKEALENKDIVEAADACGDLCVVLMGTILELGLSDRFNAVFQNIHNSNMSKACTSEIQALETLEHYKEKDGTEGYYKQDGDKWLVYRKSDNKVLKNKFYSAASLEQFLQ